MARPKPYQIETGTQSGGSELRRADLDMIAQWRDRGERLAALFGWRRR